MALQTLSVAAMDFLRSESGTEGANSTRRKDVLNVSGVLLIASLPLPPCAGDDVSALWLLVRYRR